MNGDRIVIVEPNGVKRTRPITSQTLTIGRGSDSDLAVGYTSVSRQHARISCDGGRYYVTDLDSANGTYLGTNRLVPNTPTLWASGKPLRIGDLLIYLEQTAPPVYQGEPGTAVGEETIAGFAPNELAGRKSEKKRGWTWLVVLLIVLFWIVVGLVVYYFLFA